MALAPLATAADLSDRGVPVTDTNLVAALLASASEAVRDAAGSSITANTATIYLTGARSKWLPIPLSPVRSVTDVKIDDESVADWRLRDGRLWRHCGWAYCDAPSDVELTVTFGLDSAPADIVDLVCSLVGAGMVASAEQYNPHRGETNERVDDYGHGFASGADEVVTPMELPLRTREWLRQRFGGGAIVTGSY